MIAVAPLTRQVHDRLAAPIATAATVADADRYRKHFPAEAHLWTLAWHSLAASPSLRRTHAQLDDPAVWEQLGLPSTGISRSQLARSTHSRPLACFETVFATLRDQVPVAPRPDPVHIIDSTFLGLSAMLAPWSQHGEHAPGVRVQAGVDLNTAIPSHLRVTGTNTPDITAWRERDWADLAGWTVLMDGGYYGHADFAQLQVHDVSFICPLNAQARVEVTADHADAWPPTAAGDTIRADQVITLGSPNNRGGAVLAELRLVTSVNAQGEVHRTVTDRFDLRAHEVVALYRKRWQIELFFRWLKHQLGVLRPLGTSRQAVELTLVLAAIVAILAVLLDAARPKHITDIAWVQRLSQQLLFAIIFRDGG